MNNNLTCMICGYIGKTRQGFNSHIVHAHHIDSKEYFDKYIKTSVDGICATCGKPTKFRNMWYGYNKHCCTKCIPLDPVVQEQMKKTCQLRYEVDYAWQAEQTKEKIRQTTFKHFGVASYLQTEECRQANAKAMSSPEVINKIKKTNLERRGVKCSFQDELVKEKCKAAHLKNLGVENPAQSGIVRHKAINTAMKNNIRSSLELLLESNFIKNNINYIREYKDDRYPWHCDFYLPDKDCFIEINNWWMHGKHWFDANNQQDIDTLNDWLFKSNLPQYKAAITGWTVTDLEKRDCAKKHNLNYVVLWNKQDILDWIASNYLIRQDY